MSIPTVQLAFQGGGAKFVAMLPVADAFVTAQAHGRVKIKAVAGTSAGAICAALVACNVDFSKVQSFLEAEGDHWVSKLIPPDLQPLAERQTAPKWSEWFKPKYLKLFYNVLWKGRPILNGDALFNFFRALFEASTGRSNQKIENCTSTLTIIASNIVASKAVEHKSGDLIPALTDSCALPIIFRSFSSLAGTHHVDGGLCDNLPVEGLLSDVEAPVFAIYPALPVAPPPTKNNLLTYILALLSASINHSVSRSKAMISPPFRFELTTDLELLEFKRALQTLRKKGWYEEEKKKALSRIDNFLNSYGLIDKPSSARVVDVIDVRQYRKTLAELSDDFASYFEQVRSRFMVRVNCDEVFKKDEDANDRQADTVTRVSVVKVLKEDTRYYRTNLTVVQGGIVPTVWTVRNLSRSDKDIPIRALALEIRNDQHKDARQCLIQFIDPKTHFGQGDLLEIRGIYPTSPPNDMSKLNFQKSDHFGFTNLEWPNIETAEIVLVYPKQLGKLDLVRHPDSSRQEHEMEVMKFDGHYRDVLGEKMDIIGRAVKNMKKKEKLLARVIPS